MKIEDRFIPQGLTPNYKMVVDPFEHIVDEMQNLASFKSIFAVLLFRIDGKLIESVYEKENQNGILPTLQWIKSIISKVGFELRKNLHRIAYSKRDNHIYFYKIGSSAILACVLNKYANLGLLAIEMDRISQKIENFIEK